MSLINKYKKVVNYISTLTPTNKRFLLVIFFVLSYWLKASTTYFLEFSLGISGFYQILLALLNPIPFTLLLLSLPLLLRNGKLFILTLNTVNLFNTLWLFTNVVYFKEFSDFITIDTLMKLSSVSGGLGNSALNMLSFSDLFYWMDTLFLGFYCLRKSSLFTVDYKSKKYYTLFLSSLLLLAGNLGLAEIDRPELLKRSFDNKYLVKYLGLNNYLLHNGLNSYQISQIKASASETSLAPIIEYLSTRDTEPNENYLGVAEGRDVVYIHLESIQQFLIDYKLNIDGVEYEVTPFLNSLYHSTDSVSFDNVFHQTKGGKTADAEFMIENSLFGVTSGAAMVKYSSNQFYAAPTIFKELGYTSAVFHGNTPTFWSRNTTYKSWGYDNFYSLDYFEGTEEEILGYGLLDKPFFEQSYAYYSELTKDSLTYTKYIPVTNHFPYEYPIDSTFPLALTEDETINGYFATANYFDQALEQFVNKLKEDGTYENTVFVLYGDHYGISNSRNKKLAPLLNAEVDLEAWDTDDNLDLQRVPLIYHIPNAGLNTTEINHTYGGQIDILPTLLSLMGDESNNYIHIGQDLLSGSSQNYVVLRDGTIISEQYKIVNKSKIYIYNEKVEFDLLSLEEQTYIDSLIEKGNQQLEKSDQVVMGDLLRFYTTNLDKVDVNTYDYSVPEVVTSDTN